MINLPFLFRVHNDIQSLHAIAENNSIKLIKHIFNYRLWAGNIYLFEKLKFDANIEDCMMHQSQHVKKKCEHYV